ncbi:MAG: hypothetical protein PF518_18090 [Spirochaetaceae bacterium]|jgi:hypothetical protein|nr:hypothetical protein [Spirochaetaceae bacterium]
MIKYKKRRKYKYILHEDHNYKTKIKLDKPINTEYLIMNIDGELIIKEGYCWDGPTDPAPDTKNFMQGSLVHDALYQLMREGYLDRAERDKADRILRDICIEDGMFKLFADFVYKVVKKFGAKYVKSEIISAP